MSQNRRRELGPQPRGPNGEPLCRQCHGPVKPPRQTMCSAACVHEYKLRSDPGYLRRKVHERDGGVCTECGIDTAIIARRVERLSRWVWAERRAFHPDDAMERRRRIVPRFERAVAILKRWGYSFRFDPVTWWNGISGHCWEADHIVPVIEGGGESGLENIRTLCIPCHKKATAALAKRRAEARSPQTKLAGVG